MFSSYLLRSLKEATPLHHATCVKPVSGAGEFYISLTIQQNNLLLQCVFMCSWYYPVFLLLQSWTSGKRHGHGWGQKLPSHPYPLETQLVKFQFWVIRSFKNIPYTAIPTCSVERSEAYASVSWEGLAPFLTPCWKSYGGGRCSFNHLIWHFDKSILVRCYRHLWTTSLNFRCLCDWFNPLESANLFATTTLLLSVSLFPFPSENHSMCVLNRLT